METLTSYDNIEKELTNLLNQGCAVSPNEKLLRVNFIDNKNAVCKSVRLESLKGLSKEFKDKLPVRRYIQFTNRKTGKTETVNVDGIRYLAVIPKESSSRIYGLNVSIEMCWASEDSYNDFVDKLLVNGFWPSSVFMVYVNEVNMFGDILKRYPLEIHGGNGVTGEKLSSCLFGYINDTLFKLGEEIEIT